MQLPHASFAVCLSVCPSATNRQGSNFSSRSFSQSFADALSLNSSLYRKQMIRDVDDIFSIPKSLYVCVFVRAQIWHTSSRGTNAGSGHRCRTDGRTDGWSAASCPLLPAAGCLVASQCSSGGLAVTVSLLFEDACYEQELRVLGFIVIVSPRSFTLFAQYLDEIMNVFCRQQSLLGSKMTSFKFRLSRSNLFPPPAMREFNTQLNH